MEFKQFVTDYNRYRFTPRTSAEAFRTPEYANAIEVHYARKPWRLVIGEVAAGVAVVLAFVGITYGVVRGLA